MKRWIALLASIIMQTCLGMVYAWSTFAPALAREHGTTPAQAGLIFGVCIASFTVSMIIGGKLQKKQGPRRTGMIGGFLFLGGYLAGSASSGNLVGMVCGFGLLAGAGIGFAYICPLATGIRWFPRQKGFITGLAVAGFGFGGVIFAHAGQQMIEACIPVLVILLRIGLAVGITVVFSSVFLFVPTGIGTKPVPSAPVMPPPESVCSQLRFRRLFWQMFCGTFGGLLVVGNLKTIGLVHGLSPETAARGVMLFAVGNAAGRVLWGWWYDRLGAVVITWCMVLLAAGALLMGGVPGRVGFFSASVITAFAFGGFFVLFAARVADQFGVERLSEVYPLVFLGYGLAGLAGPPVGGWLLARTGTALIPSLSVILLASLAVISSARSHRSPADPREPAQANTSDESDRPDESDKQQEKEEEQS